MGTVFDPFSAHRYLGFQGELSQTTLAHRVATRLAAPEGIAILVFGGHSSLDANLKALLEASGDPRKNLDPAMTGFAPTTLDPRRAVATVNSTDERTLAHELGHCLFLAHADARANTDDGLEPRPTLHDADSPRCLMNYDPDDVQLCGLCQLRLRGWDTRALSNKAADNEKAGST